MHTSSPYDTLPAAAPASDGRVMELESAQEQLLAREGEAKRRSDFLADASRLLALSLDFETTLSAVAALALPFLGSWCFVDVVLADGSMRRLAVIHPDASRQLLARKLEAGWPPERDDPVGVPRAMRTRRSEVIPHVTDEMLRAAARDPENLDTLRQLGIGSLMVVPLIARDEVLGAITFVGASTGHQYTEDDLDLAEDLAARGATAIDNALLFRAAERARAEAEEANRAKSLFLTTMSHELRTPLNAIAGYAELLEMEIKGPLNEEQRDQVARIQTNQRHLLGLVNAVLDFAKLSAGRMELRLEPVLIEEVLDAVEPMVAPLAAKKGLAYPHECSGAGVVAHADREKVEQILVNLLTNAVKFTASDGRIDLACTVEGEQVVVRVRDTGIGVAAEHLESIFEPFVQVRDGLTRTEEGTGLGLAISRSLAREMGGALEVQSQPGEGSTFVLRLPRG
jgi:signal transduction histidine kinase